ncbi:AlbA family DNA-binding domain-containing protein [Cellulomonas marina]|uniref:Putative DNA-binding domain-containing protein n=1 Tax=Cellulomonas marina TaxID=988821 RepID=A0A1I1AVR5_9CELL|nr:ATP-binding protein [Cellulomonas marina]GIG29266.1 hypothetical protein Cma02nite_18660 [Cellulomonas marina]SFB40430.1 Putative DNA-binding domain-containing protein [Cellulomonas marina]
MITESFYLGPTRRPVPLTSWDEVVSAAQAGVLDETQWVELKQDVPASSKSANLELAKDLASLSVDGGLLVIGVADADRKAGDVVGARLQGLETRIDQVAGGQITPPLSVTIVRVDHPDDDERGVLLVGVPASPDAPHMVDGAYWARGATGKRRLSDPEVRRLMTARQAQTAGFETRLRAMAEDFEIPALTRRKGHVYLLAEPLAPVHAQPAAGHHETLLQMVTSAVRFRPQFIPTIESLTYQRADPDGLAATSFPPTEQLKQDLYALRGLVADDGQIAMTSSGGTTDPSDFNGERPSQQFVDAGHILELTHCLAEITGHLSSERFSYGGPWRLGVRVDRLYGVPATAAMDDRMGRRFAGYPRAEFVRVVTATTGELVSQTPDVVGRLLEPLLRGLGVTSQYLPYTDPRSFAGGASRR